MLVKFAVGVFLESFGVVLVVPQLRTGGRFKWILISLGKVLREGIMSGHSEWAFGGNSRWESRVYPCKVCI